MGLPGLLLALVFTGMAVWHIWVTFWGNTQLGQKVIAMLVLVLMGAGILEPYLFFTDIFYHYTDFIFFLCLGYLVHWRSDMQK
jgi:O-antigen ligase